MKVSWRWLREYVETDLEPREMARRLTMAGLEAEKIEEIGAEWDRDLVRVALVTRVAAIPGAERVRQVFLELPEREVMVVTGAPNIAVGQKIALGLLGAKLYDGHSDEKTLKVLKSRPIMGLTGEGMVCSERELGISDEHEGIMVLPEDAPIGMPLVDYLGDTVIEFEITPNLVHDFSIIGVAREAAAVTGGVFHDPFPRWPAYPDAPEMPELVAVEATPDLVPRFTALVIEGVTVGPSPEWMQRRLNACGLRPVSNIVDVTNYVMLEYGQPSHAYDRDRLAGGRLIVRPAQQGETLELINHEIKTLTPAMLAVCDEDGVTNVGGVIGGTRSEIADDTTTVLLEAANWEMRNIRHTRIALKVRTDAAARYERGIEPDLTMPAALRCAELIAHICPGAKVTGYTDIYRHPRERVIVDLPYRLIERVLGVTYPVQTVVEVLTRLQFDVALSQDTDGPEPLDAFLARLQSGVVDNPDAITFRVRVPVFRTDVSRPEDLIEEVARIVGYESLPETLPTGTTVHVVRPDRLLTREAARDAVAAVGLFEVQTYSFTSAAELDKLATVSGAGATEAPLVRLANPMGEWEALRPTLRGSLLALASENLKFVPGVAVGEVANVYLPTTLDELPTERLTLGIVLAGERGERNYASAPHPYDFWDIKGVAEAIFPALGMTELAFAAADDPVFQPGRTAMLSANGQPLGLLGEVHPRVAAAFEIPGRVFLAEFDLEPAIASVASKRGVLRKLPPLSRYPAVEQDLAVVVDENITAWQVADVVRAAIGGVAARVQLFDVYRGEQVAVGKKSLAFAVTLQAPNRVLSEEEVTKVRDRVSGALTKRLKATLRT